MPILLLALLVPRLTPPDRPRTDPVHLAKPIFSGRLVALLGVAAIYRRRRSGGDSGQVDRLAHAFRLGETFWLRPFISQKHSSPGPDVPLRAYHEALEAPDVVQLPWVWGYVLCVVTLFLVSWLVMFELHMRNHELHTPLLGGMRLLGDICVTWSGEPPCYREPGAPTAVGAWNQPLGKAIVRDMTEGLFWVDLAFLGAYLWSTIYLVWRMAVLDLTGHAFNVITVRVVASAILAILFDHLDASTSARRP